MGDRGTMAPAIASKLQRGCDNNVPIAGGVTCRHRQLFTRLKNFNCLKWDR
jgi:hypothetical protein